MNGCVHSESQGKRKIGKVCKIFRASIKYRYSPTNIDLWHEGRLTKSIYFCAYDTP